VKNVETETFDSTALEGEKAYRRISGLVEGIDASVDYQRQKALALENPNNTPRNLIIFRVEDHIYKERRSLEEKIDPHSGEKKTIQILELWSETHSLYIGSEYFEEEGINKFYYGYTYVYDRKNTQLRPENMDEFIAEQFPYLYHLD
jgi:hypothetical protein